MSKAVQGTQNLRCFGLGGKTSLSWLKTAQDEPKSDGMPLDAAARQGGHAQDRTCLKSLKKKSAQDEPKVALAQDEPKISLFLVRL